MTEITPWFKQQTMIKRAYLQSPGLCELITMNTHSADSVEFIVTRLDGKSFTDRWLPYTEAINYRASLIHRGWIEPTAPERF